MDRSNVGFSFSRALAFTFHLLALPAAGQLVASGNQFWSQASDGIAGVEESEDTFGWALASGDFDVDGFEDLAIAAPGESIGSTVAGAIVVLYGSTGGLSGVRSQLWHQETPGLQGTNERYDSFGSSLAAADFDGDGRSDLAVGAMGERNGSGAVWVLYGTPGAGLAATGHQLLEPGHTRRPWRL